MSPLRVRVPCSSTQRRPRRKVLRLVSLVRGRGRGRRRASGRGRGRDGGRGRIRARVRGGEESTGRKTRPWAMPKTQMPKNCLKKTVKTYLARVRARVRG